MLFGPIPQVRNRSMHQIFIFLFIFLRMVICIRHPLSLTEHYKSLLLTCHLPEVSSVHAAPPVCVQEPSPSNLLLHRIQ